MAEVRLATSLFLFIAVFHVCSAAHSNETSLVVVTSDVIVPNTEFAVYFQLDQLNIPMRGDPNLQISIEIQDLAHYRVIWNPELRPATCFSRTFKVLVPADEKLFLDSHKVTIKSNGFVEFEHEIQLAVKWRNASIKVYAGLQIFKPGDTMEISFISFKNNSKPFLGPLNISIYSQDVPVAKWINEMPKNGIIRHKFRIPLVEKAGELVVLVENKDQIEREIFWIAVPEGKQFLVKLNASKFHLINSSDKEENANLSVSIAANHYSGAPLSGRANITIKLQPSDKVAYLDPVDVLHGSGEVSLNPNELKKLLQMSSEETLLNKSVEISVRVQELLQPSQRDKSLRHRVPGHVEENVNITFLDQSYPLTFNEFTTKASKTDLLFWGYASSVNKESEHTGSTLLPIKAKEGGDHAIRVFLDQEQPKVQVEKSLNVKIESTFPVDRLTYHVTSDSVLVLSGEICSSKPSKSHQLSLHIPKNVSHLLYSPRLVIWTQTPGHEIVVDSLTFLVYIEDKVEIALHSDDIEQGDFLEIYVKAKPYSDVDVYLVASSPIFVSDSAEISQSIDYFILNADKLKMSTQYSAKTGSNTEVTFRTNRINFEAFVMVEAMVNIPGSRVIFAETETSVGISSQVYADIDHPVTILRGEYFMVNVELESWFENETQVEVSITENEGIKILCQESKVQRVTVGGLATKNVTFSVRSMLNAPKDLKIQIVIKANGTESKLLNSTVQVQHKGLEVKDERMWLLDNFQEDEELEIDVKKQIREVIINTQQTVVKVYGDLLGPVIERVCHDSNPSLLEDRTKLNFVQTLHVIKHIATNPLFENAPKVNQPILKSNQVHGLFEVHVDKENCIRSGLESIQYLLNKQYPGGFYSFHPGSSGYLWLTSMMLDSMVELVQVLPRHNEEAERAARWLVSRQKEDGSYVEEKEVLSLRVHNLKDIPLTAQVVSSLIRAKEYLPLETEDVKLIDASVSKSMKFLEEALAAKEVAVDAYLLNIGAYALVLGRSDKVHEVLEKRDKLVIEEGGKLHWRVAEYDDFSSLSVEATAYAALTHLEMGGLEGSRPIINWLISQMNNEGSFVYVEDTSIALKAMTLYSRLLQEHIGHQSINVDVDLTASDKNKTSVKVVHPLFAGSVFFDHTNMSLGCPLKVETSGSGLILVQSVARYNVPIPSRDSDKVTLKIETKDFENHLEVKVCTGSLNYYESGFAVIEVPLLSSYAFDLRRNLERNGKQVSQQIFEDDRTVWIILDKLPAEPVCFNLEFDEVHVVENQEPRPIRSYALLEPSMAAIRPYVNGIKRVKDKVCP